MLQDVKDVLMVEGDCGDRKPEVISLKKGMKENSTIPRAQGTVKRKSRRS